MEIIVTLHTAAGDVVTCYPMSMLKDALEHAAQYARDGKKFTLRNG